MQDYADVFQAIPSVAALLNHVHHHFILQNPNMTIVRRQYSCPKKYREAWKHLLQGYLKSGWLCPSSSLHASPAFLVFKSNPTTLPRWINDYCQLNANTVSGAHSLLTVQEILSDVGNGKFWRKLNISDSFFQTKVHPDNIKYTAITTPFGFYEWTVMPQGCCNAPATHQCCMFNALRPYIGSICHIYIDDIAIWLQTLEEHRPNITKVTEALHMHALYCSSKKTMLFTSEIFFLGHKISRKGIEADGKKVKQIVNWPIPASASDVHSFLRHVRYIANFLLAFRKHTLILNPLTTKEAEKEFDWQDDHQKAFEAIKALVLSCKCLTVIDHNHIWATTRFSSLVTPATPVLARFYRTVKHLKLRNWLALSPSSLKVLNSTTPPTRKSSTPSSAH